MTQETYRFRVWAPAAQHVEVELSTGRHAMTRHHTGWWAADLAARAGDAYLFVMDGAPLPDPRSQAQPAGVRGPSRVVDHDAFG
jgi:maltooligosyltrehalose trehalohydrolase